MKLTFIDKSLTNIETFGKFFKKNEHYLPGHQFKFAHGDFGAFYEELDRADYLLSPGNSFGIMDGGFDKVVNDMFGVQKSIQSSILKLFGGILPIGDVVLDSDPDYSKRKIRNILYAPTMIFPSKISDSWNVFFANFACFHFISDGRLMTDVNDEVISPCFGIATGGLEPAEAARQTFTAIFMSLNRNVTENWEHAMNKVKMINGWLS